jgi:periplasmic protein TonB
MFEDSLVESRVGEVSSSKRWTALASVSLQFAVAGLVIALPLWHPEALPFHVDAPKMLLPLAPKPLAAPVRVQPATGAASSHDLPSMSQPSLLRSLLPARGIALHDEPSLVSMGVGMGLPDGLPSGLTTGEGGPHPNVSVASARTPGKTLPVSSGVLQGMLLAPIRPVYPAIAKAAHVEGAVVVEAIISRTGTIESLHVLSGPAMLQGAAIEAIRGARYQPYRLNGEPTEVQTTITVNFRIGG